MKGRRNHEASALQGEAEDSWTLRIEWSAPVQPIKTEKKQRTEKKILGFSSGSVVKNLPTMQELQETWVRSLGREDPLEKETHSSILAWRIPWTEEPGGL